MIRGISVLAVLAIALSCATSPASATPQTSALTINLLGCTSKDDPRMRITDVSNRLFRLDAQHVTSITGGYRAVFRVPTGAYRIMAAAGECGGAETVGVLSGLDRTVTVFGSHLASLAGRRAAVAGTLPIDGLRVSVVTKISAETEVETPADICGRTFYVDDYPASTNVVLRIYSQQYQWIDIPLTQGSMPRSFIRLDISMNVLAEKATGADWARPRPGY